MAIILGLLFLFKTVVDSGTISIRHLSPSDSEFQIGSPGMELSKALSFLGVGVGAWIDLAKAMGTGLVPPNIPSAVIHLIVVCIFAICVVCCFARFTVALKNRPRRSVFLRVSPKLGFCYGKPAGESQSRAVCCIYS